MSNLNTNYAAALLAAWMMAGLLAYAIRLIRKANRPA